MENILFVCNAGVSTTYLISRLEKYDVNNKYSFTAIPISELENYMKENEVKAILIGPQISFLADSIQAEYGDNIYIKTIPIELFKNVDAKSIYGDLENNLKNKD